jgi:hypothetical protein
MDLSRDAFLERPGPEEVVAEKGHRSALGP